MAKKKNNEDDLMEGFGAVTDEAQQEDLAQALEELGSIDGPPRFKVVDGLNVFWALPPLTPPLGTMKNFIERVKIHFGPMHVCGRSGKRPNPLNPTDPHDDSNFKNCARCIAAWNAYEAAGKPGTRNPKDQNPTKDKFKSDLGNDQGLIQGIDFTGFFIQRGEEPELDPNTADRVNDYLEAMLIEDESEKASRAAELFEDVTDEDRYDRLVEGVMAGVSPLYFNYEVTNDLEGVESKCRRDWKKRKKRLPAELKQVVERGPLNHPEYFLTWVSRHDGQEEFESRGKKRRKKVYSFAFLTPDDTEAVGDEDGKRWNECVNRMALWRVAKAQAIDLKNPTFDADAELSVRARGFARLTDAEIMAYLEESDHSFVYTPNGQDASSGGNDVTDPDSFGGDASPTASFGPVDDGDSVHSDSDAADAIAKARAKRRSKEEEAAAE